MQNRDSSLLRALASLSQAEAERVEEVLRLLETLFQREEATAKSILDCLYDVGAGHLIDQKVPVQMLRRPFKRIARLSKPVFRILALRWFKRHCPWLITRWLFNLLRFDGPPLIEEDGSAQIIDVAPAPVALPPPLDTPLLERQAAEINALRGKVGWLTAAVVVLAILGGLNWLS